MLKYQAQLFISNLVNYSGNVWSGSGITIIVIIIMGASVWIAKFCTHLYIRMYWPCTISVYKLLKRFCLQNVFYLHVIIWISEGTKRFVSSKKQRIDASKKRHGHGWCSNGTWGMCPMSSSNDYAPAWWLSMLACHYKIDCMHSIVFSAFEFSAYKANVEPKEYSLCIDVNYRYNT